MATLFSSAVLVICIAAIYSLWERYSPYSRRLGASIVTDKVRESYDYVIIGSGSAGSVLGSRLSEDDSTVLILEAGDHFDINPSIHVPAYAGDLYKTDIDWNYLSEPETSAFLGLDEGKATSPRGRTLGGTSSINYCTHVRGSPLLYDEWVTKYGCNGWGYKDFLPYFKKLEDVRIPELQNSEYRGFGGPIAVTNGTISDLDEYVLEAAREIGYDVIDYNGESQSGFSSIQFSIRDGVRSSTGVEYLGKIKKRDNLDISVNSVVTKIDVVGRRARGVFFVKDGRKHYVQVNREAILSAGAINSPQILLLSGIGPRKHLEELGIPVVADLPVGRKLQDHLGIVLHTKINKPLSLSGEIFQSAWSKLQYALFGTGPLAFIANIGQGFVHIDKSKIGKAKPDAQFIFAASLITFNSFLNYNQSVAEELLYRHEGTRGFSTIAMLLEPGSLGSVSLRSTDPFDPPAIKIRPFSDKHDIEKMIAVIRVLEELVSTKSMQSIGADMSINKASFCAHHKFQSDDFWRCMLKHIAITFCHTSTTCRMGPTGDRDSVVDLELKVQGFENLRVVDASVFPSIPTGNTNVPTIALAEKAADLIRAG